MQYLLGRRQFVIARSPVTIDPSWKVRPLPDGWLLSSQEELAISDRTVDGRAVLVLGVADGEETLDTATSGRYAMIDWPFVSTDQGAGLLPAFYAAGGGVVSSSAGLAASLARGEPADGPAAFYPLPDHGETLKFPSPMNYVPSPGTRYRGIRRLMRDQRLNIVTGEVEHRPAPLPAAGSYQQAVDAVAEELTRAARVLRERTPGRIHLQLTAGLDTRTMLAAFSASGVAFETVTFRYPFKPDEDASLAATLSRELGVRHSVVEGKPTPDAAAGEAYLRQIAGNMNGVDLNFLFPCHAYRFLEAGDTMVGGLGFEVGRQKFRSQFGELDLGTATGAALWQGLTQGAGPSDFPAFIDEWLDWRRRHPYPFDLVASTYLDQRLGAWGATLLTGFDLLPGATVHPAASARVMAAMLSAPFEAQVEGRLQRDVIRALAPKLLAHPFNPVPLRRQLRGVVSRAKRRVRKLLGQGRPPAASAS